MRSTSILVAVAFFVFLFSIPSAFASADEAKKVFDSLFAPKIKAVGATIDRADDIALGREMLAIAKTSEEQPDLLVLLCDQVHDLCIKHADGFAIAVEAQQLLADKVETKRAGAQEKLTTLLTRQMTTGKADEREGAGESLIALLLSMGDEKFEKKQYAEAAGDYRRAVTVATQRKASSLEEAKGKLEFATARDRAAKNLARLQEKLLKDANDFATAEEIVKLYVVELDDPAGAVPYLNRVKDEKLKLFALDSGKTLESLSDDQLLALGEWYCSLAAGQTGTAALIPLQRGADYLTRYINVRGTSHLQGTKAEVLLKDINLQLDKTPITSRPPRAGPGKIPDITEGWSARCWLDGQWRTVDLSKLETKATSEALVVKNTTGIHTATQLCFGSAVDGDFDFEIELFGGDAVQISAADGGDRIIFVRLSATPQWQIVRIVRKKGALQFFLGGKPATPKTFGTDDQTMRSCINVLLRTDETVKVRRVVLRSAK